MEEVPEHILRKVVLSLSIRAQRMSKLVPRFTAQNLRVFVFVRACFCLRSLNRMQLLCLLSGNREKKIGLLTGKY